MVWIVPTGKTIYGRFCCEGNIWLRDEVADIEEGEAHRRSRFKGGTDLIPSV